MNTNSTTGARKKIDLSTEEMQLSFKKIRRVSIFTSVIMALFTLFAAGLAIWVAAEKTQYVADWSVIVYICLMGFCAVLFGFMFFREAILHIPYKRTLHEYVCRSYEEHAEIMTGCGKLNFEMALIADKLTVFKEGSEPVIQFDLSPIQDYTGVCAYVHKLAKKYIADYYFVHAKEYGVSEVRLFDMINGKRKEYVILSPEKAIKKGGDFVKWQLV